VDNIYPYYLKYMNLLKGKLKLSLIASVCTMFLSTIKDEAFGFTFSYTGYTAGTTAQDLPVTGGSDIQISYPATTFGFINGGALGIPTPDDSTTVFGGSTANKLVLAQDLNSGAGTSNIFTAPTNTKNTINFLFNQPGISLAPELVRSVSFNILDVDRDIVGGNNFQDFIGIRGCNGTAALTNCTIVPTLVAINAAFTTINNSNGTAFGNSTGVANTSPSGNVGVSFGSTQINAFQIFYGSGTSLAVGNLDPGVQTIAISSVSFEAVPFEFETGIGLSLLGGFWALRRLNSRRRIA
jgi:hypothetical protein